VKIAAAVEAKLARAVAAYLRHTPAHELPTKLRPIARFRDQALKPHRAKLIAALDDDDFRNKILDWLKDSPTLKTEEARVLTIAAKREEGWEGELQGTTPKAAPKRTKTDEERLRDELERERGKVAKLKDELRALKEETRETHRSTKAHVAELTSELRDLKADLRKRDTELKSVRTQLARAEQNSEKDTRSLRRDAERATGAKQAADERVVRLKREVAELKRDLVALEGRLSDERAKSEGARRAARSRTRSSGPRRQLKAPKGLLADAPKTLAAWLGTDGVRLIVDGYNVGKATTGFPGLELEAMRKRLVDEVAKLARSHGIEATIVFDGADVGPGTRRLRRPPVKIEYSPPDVIADDVIVQRVEEAPSGPLVVATNDKELQGRVAALGATVATSDQLLALFTGRKLS
jgi:predicted RNA-binding protein with PIN domain